MVRTDQYVCLSLWFSLEGETENKESKLERGKESCKHAHTHTHIDTVLCAITNSDVCVRDGYISLFPLQSQIPWRTKNIGKRHAAKKIHNPCAYLCGGIPNSKQYHLTSFTTSWWPNWAVYNQRTLHRILYPTVQCTRLDLQFQCGKLARLWAVILITCFFIMIKMFYFDPYTQFHNNYT